MFFHPNAVHLFFATNLVAVLANPAPQRWSERQAPAAPAVTAASVTPTGPSSTNGPKPSSGSSSSSGSKRGISYNKDSPSLDPLTKLAAPQISWMYNWAPARNPEKDKNVDFLFIPTDWAGTDPDFIKDAEAEIDKGATHVFSFNEPDQTPDNGGSNIKVDAAVPLFQTRQKELLAKKPNVKFAAPSVCSGGGPDGGDPTIGLGWLKDFLSKCNSCQIDILNIHWYGSNKLADAATDIDAEFKALKAQVEGTKKIMTDTQLASKYKNIGKWKIWVTEFQHLGPPESQKPFMQQALPYLDGEDAVEKYAYFMWENYNTTNGQGGLSEGNKISDLGNLYVGGSK